MIVDDDLARVRALIDQIGTAYKAAGLINDHLEARGFGYQVSRSTIDSMHHRGRGKPAMVALVRLVLEDINRDNRKTD